MQVFRFLAQDRLHRQLPTCIERSFHAYMGGIKSQARVSYEKIVNSDIKTDKGASNETFN